MNVHKVKLVLRLKDLYLQGFIANNNDCHFSNSTTRVVVGVAKNISLGYLGGSHKNLNIVEDYY